MHYATAVKEIVSLALESKNKATQNGRAGGGDIPPPAQLHQTLK